MRTAGRFRWTSFLGSLGITDNFNRANNASLGTTSDGKATWNLLKGTGAIISSNAAGAADSTTTVAKVTALSAAMTVSAKLVTGTGGSGIVARCSDGNNFWMVSCSGINSGLFKVVANTFTRISTFTVSSGNTVSLVCSGNTVSAKVNGATVSTTTDSFNSTATGAGLYFQDATSRFDDFSVV